jgi:hypothetical protein
LPNSVSFPFSNEFNFGKDCSFGAGEEVSEDSSSISITSGHSFAAIFALYVGVGDSIKLGKLKSLSSTST